MIRTHRMNMMSGRYLSTSWLRPLSMSSAASPTLPPISDCGPSHWPTPSYRKSSSRRRSRAASSKDISASLSYFVPYVDGPGFPGPGRRHVRCPSLHGLDGMLPAHPASALGRIPEQVLQRKRINFYSLQL